MQTGEKSSKRAPSVALSRRDISRSRDCFLVELGLSIAGVVITALIGIGGLWLRQREIADGESRRILRDLEIVDALPETSAARSNLLALVDAAVMAMILNRATKRRNGGTIAIGVFFMLLSALLLAGISQGGWWWFAVVPLVFTATFALYGTIEGSIKGERDARGNLVSKRARHTAELAGETIPQSVPDE